MEGREVKREERRVAREREREKEKEKAEETESHGLTGARIISTSNARKL